MTTGPARHLNALRRRVARWLSEHSCRHDWDYGPPGATGWGVVRCRNCGETDIYA